MTMSNLDRRSFIRGAGASALLTAATFEPAMAKAPSVLMRSAREDFDFDSPYDRVGTDCIKWDTPLATYDGIQVGMGIADMDFRAAPCITEALAKRCAHENWGYLRRPQRYSQAVVDWNMRRYGLEIDPESIVWTTGVHPGIIAALQTLAPPGTRVVMNTPTYNGFYTDVRFAHNVAEDNEMKVVDGRYQIDWDDFERRVRRSNVFILCNPQNPTGNCWSADDMTRMGEICLEHNTVVLSDEIHCDFVSAGEKYTPFASLPNREIVDNSITFKAASKTFSLAAMKVAWYFSTNPTLLARVRANTRADLTTLGMEANYAALTEGDEWFDQLSPYLDANHNFAEKEINSRLEGIRYTKAQGTYLAWLDVNGFAEAIDAAGIAARENETAVTQVTPETIVQRWFANEAGVYLNPGHSYGTGGAGHMRMNLGTSRQMISTAIEKMAEAIARI